MPILRSHTVLEVARGIKAFLNLETGLTRGAVPDPERSSKQARRIKNQTKQLEQLRKRLSNMEKNLRQARRKPANKDRESTESPAKPAESTTSSEASGIKPENIVWIFGFGRSGSTWLRSLMTEPEDHQLWEEPLVGLLFGNFYDTWGTGDPRVDRKDFVFGVERKIWLNLIRSFVLERINAQFSEADGRILITKESNGSIGASVLMEAIPESRMVLLIRDPRDVMASFIASQNKGGWARELVGDNKLIEFDATKWAHVYIKHLNYAKQAYEAHDGYKVIVKYEQLLADPVRSMKRVYSGLGITFSEQELAKAVEKHSWENIPEYRKGPGRFNRKATPGAWREDLSVEQIEAVEKIAAPILEEFYSQG